MTIHREPDAYHSHSEGVLLATGPDMLNEQRRKRALCSGDDAVGGASPAHLSHPVRVD